MKRLLIALFLLLNLTPASAAALKIDGWHSAVVFSWNHFGFANPVARFEQVEGELLLDENDLSKSSVNVRIPVSSVRTGVEVLDKRLKTADFFDEANHPVMTFRSVQVGKESDGRLKVSGLLTIKGVAKPVVLHVRVNKIQVEAPGRVNRAGFDAEAVLLRSDFGIDRYVPAVTDEITIRITLEAFLD